MPYFLFYDHADVLQLQRALKLSLSHACAFAQMACSLLLTVTAINLAISWK